MIAQVSEELVWNQIVAKAWCDESFMKRLLSDPRAVLAEHDLEVPYGTEVEVMVGQEVKVDDSDTIRRFILPASPAHELLDEELVPDAVAYCACGACGRCGACGCRCRC
jgi:hypothetical protein